MFLKPISTAFLICAVTCASAQDDSKAAKARRGAGLYVANCMICHQVTGQGAPGSFPPLAGSDFLVTEREKSIRGLVEGLSGPILVKGQKYDGYMPPVLLNDAQVSDVLTYVRNSWGNSNEVVTAEEVKTVRSHSKYPTFEALKEANMFAPLPKPPAGLALRELARLPAHGTRLTSRARGGPLYLLGEAGDLWRIETTNGAVRQILSGKDYLIAERGAPSTVGVTFDREQRLYVVANHRNESGPIVSNNVAIYRSAPAVGVEPSGLKPWLTTNYPWGIGPFNHGVGNIAQGPDGFLYVTSGSRTDGSEAGTDPHFSTMGEHPLTACIWRLDPKTEKPAIEIFARGHRNAYGFCWNEKGEMFSTDNGPDADAPEELNRVEQGRHYGFPFQFSNWTNKPYAYTPDPPPGVRFTRPVANLGPAGGFDGTPLYTFDPHSSPGGIVALGADFPEAYRDSLFVVRFGNLLKKPKDVGFDLLQMKVEPSPEGTYRAKTTTILAPLARPLDLHLGDRGKIYILEYSRSTNFGGSLGPAGRILELSARPASGAR